MPTKASNLRLLLLLTLIIAAYAVQEARTRQQKVYHSYPSQRELPAQKINRRVMIGSTAPRCTYNECRGCRYNCRAEQVPVEGNDPMNSAYHYRCVCHK